MKKRLLSALPSTGSEGSSYGSASEMRKEGPERQSSPTPPFPTFEAKPSPDDSPTKLRYFTSGGGNFSNIFLTA